MSESFLPPPTLVVYWNFGGMPIPVNAPLLWHWQEGVRAATGWDIQSRLHVRGTAEQFADWQLLQWRYMADQWCLLTRTSMPCRYADCLYLSLRAEPSSLISVYAALKSLYESLKEIPIIVVSREALFARQVARILREHLQLNAWSEEPGQADRQPTGYYRLLADCRYRARTHTRASAHRTDSDCQTDS